MYEKTYFLLLFVTILPLFTYSSFDTLLASESLNFNQTLISSEQKYEAGFFTPQGAESDKIYLGIWYYKLSDAKTVVWVANRDTPTRSSSSIALELGSDGGGHIVITEQGVAIWVSNNSSGVVTSPVLQLLDTGNLVMREASNYNVDDYIWQSFDYPTDTLLPGQKLGWTKKTGLDRRLVSWKSASDPGTGDYSYTMNRSGNPEIFLKAGTRPIFRTGPFTGQGLVGVPAMKPSTGINFTLYNTQDEVYYMFSLIDQSIKSRFVMGSDGVTYRYVWVPDSRGWSPFWYHPQEQCDKYMTCGPYGLCDNSKLFDCGCPQGFVAKDSSAVSLRDGSHGCVRRTRLECGTDGFVEMEKMKVPVSGAATVDMGKGLEECKVACKKDCGCTAYASARAMDGDGRGCVMWTGDLLDMRNFQEGGQDLYVRVAASDLSTTNPTVSNKTNKAKIGIGMSVVAVTFMVAIVIYFAWNAKHQSSANGLDTRHGLQLVGATTPKKESYIHSTNADDLELPLYDFDAIVVATNNFSGENMLGRGGFGCVFKGVLNGVQEIAVKRLSKGSGQGFEEFKNEANLIAKLQHRNLVRLLGYCVEREEKMLIYEYLRNRSLDFVLFHKERCSHLDWKRRFNIICGVARGLIYLHHDSRLRIIHRDLKASNILLDDDMNPKISDFGMARIFKGDETEANNTRRVVGTYGYMSPEYAMDGAFSIKSDVFSFGVLLLEIVTGKQNRVFRKTHQQLNLLGYTWKMWEEGKGAELLDPSIRECSFRLHEVLKCVQVGLLCVQAHPNERPTMSSVVLMLSSENASLPQPKLPGYYLEWRPMGETGLVQCQKDEICTINQVTFTTLGPR